MGTASSSRWPPGHQGHPPPARPAQALGRADRLRHHQPGYSRRRPIAAGLLACWVRGHWSIEARLHWVRDVTFGEDHSQIRTDNGAPARVVERARIVLLAADGVPGQQIAEMVGCAEGGGDLARALRRARPGRTAGPAPSGQALAAAGGAAGSGADPDPDRAADRPEGDALVLAAAGRRAGRGGHPDLARDHRPNLAPLRGAALARGDVQFSTDPALEANVRDVVGLYLHPPEKA